VKNANGKPEAFVSGWNCRNYEDAERKGERSTEIERGKRCREDEASERSFNLALAKTASIEAKEYRIISKI
jgi:hypothetical protein